MPLLEKLRVFLDGSGAEYTHTVHSIAYTAREVASAEHLPPREVAKTVVVHGGNGRLPGLLGRRLGLPSERVWSETPRTGNLGAASLPVAWAAHADIPAGPIIWTAVGAGLTWGAALLERERPSE